MPLLTRKLKNLPAAITLSDTDIIVNEDDTTTQKVTLYQIVNYICNHNIIKNAFAAKDLFEDHVSNMTMHVTATDKDNWNSANGQKHSHSNKTVLDSITQTLINNWNDANSKKHTHSNKTVLDGITAEKIEEWDNATSTGGDGHTHNNKTVLDNITQAKVTAWDNAANLVEIISSSEPSQQAVNGHWLQPY